MCCPFCEAPVKHAVPCCSHQCICLGVGSPVSSSVAHSQLSNGLSFFSPGLLSPSLFREGLSFKFLLFPILVPCPDCSVSLSKGLWLVVRTAADRVKYLCLGKLNQWHTTIRENDNTGLDPPAKFFWFLPKTLGLDLAWVTGLTPFCFCLILLYPAQPTSGSCPSSIYHPGGCWEDTSGKLCSDLD